MKLFTKAALGALMLAGATAMTTVPADARVSVGIGFGFPGYYGGYYGPPPYYAYPYCDPYSRWYDPYRCGDGYYPYDDYYYGPVFINGFWFDGGFRSRFFHGHREFFHHGGWHSGTGWNEGGFHHGGGGTGTTSGGGGTWHGGSGGTWHGGTGGTWHGGSGGTWHGGSSGSWGGGGGHHH